jgi:hypothetical protein
MDFVVCLFAGPPKLFFNAGNTKFVDVSPILNVNANIASYRARDFDNDGSCDIAFLDFSGNIIMAKNVKNFAIAIDSSNVINSTIIEKKNGNNLIKIAPNPFIVETFLQCDHNLSNAKIELVNVFGQTVKQVKNISGHSITLRRDNLPSGMYFLRLIEDSRLIATKKIILTD